MNSFLDWLLIFGILQVLLLLFIFIGIPILLLRFIFGRGSRSSSSSSVGTQQTTSRVQKGFPTSMYVGSNRLSNFKVDPGLYDFRTPRVEPNLEGLKKSADVDIAKASSLFLGRRLDLDYLGLPKKPALPFLDMDRAKELFLPGIGKVIEHEEEDESEEESFS